MCRNMFSTPAMIWILCLPGVQGWTKLWISEHWRSKVGTPVAHHFRQGNFLIDCASFFVIMWRAYRRISETVSETAAEEQCQLYLKTELPWSQLNEHTCLDNLWCVTSSPQQRVLHNNILQYIINTYPWRCMDMFRYVIVIMSAFHYYCSMTRFRTFSARRILASGTRALRFSQSKALQKSRRSWHKFHRQPWSCHGKNQHGRYCLIWLNILNLWWFQHKFYNNSQFAGVDMCNHQEHHVISYLLMCIQQFWSFWSSVRGAKARSVSLFPYLGIEAPSETCPCFNMFATHKQLSFSDPIYLEAKTYSLQVDEHSEWSGFAGEWPWAQNQLNFQRHCFFFNSSLKSELSWTLLMVSSEAEIREDVGRRSFWSLHRTHDFQAEY